MVMLGEKDSGDGGAKQLARRLEAARRQAGVQVNSAAELWAAFDRFCLDVAGRPGASVVSVFSPGERDRFGVIVPRARRGLDESRIVEALAAMKSFWEGFIGSEDETVLVLE